MLFVALGFGVLAVLIHGYRLSAGPDLFSDEGLYLLVGRNLAGGAGLMADHGPFFWHPPLYMLVEAMYIKTGGLLQYEQEPVRLLFAVRWLNVFFSGATAALLVLFGRRLLGLKAGGLMAALFVLDPYVQRINRRSMLETLAMLLVLAGLYIFVSQPAQSRRRWLGSGVAFGLALLTKEAMVLELLALVAYAAWNRKQLGDVLRTIGVALATYLLYPVWALTTGQGGDYLAFRLYGLGRVASLLTSTSAPRPPLGSYLPTSEKTLSLQNLSALLSQYAMTYLLLALALVAIVTLLFKHRGRPEAHYLLAWSIVSFLAYGVLARISDQYFYYLVVPAVAVTGFVAMELLQGMRPPQDLSREAHGDPGGRHHIWVPAVGWPLLVSIGIGMSVYNAHVWVEKFATGSDNAYSKILDSVRKEIPKGSAIVVSDDVPNFFLPSNLSYEIRFDRDPGVVVGRHEEYFIMSSKDSWGGYDAMSPEFYEWVLRESRPLVVEHGDSFGTVGLYYRNASGASTP